MKKIALIVLILSSFSFAQAKEKTTAARDDEAKPEVINNIFPEAALSKTGVDVHVQLGLPYGGALGLDYFTPDRTWSFGFMAGGFHGEQDEVKYSLNQFALVGRWFPWQSAFYLGLMAGAQKVHLTATEEVSGVTGEATLDVKDSFITPNIGWMWSTTYGLSWGFELGVQAPFSQSTDLSVNTTNPIVLNDPDFQKAYNDAKDAGDKFGHQVLPYITLLRLGYVF